MNSIHRTTGVLERLYAREPSTRAMLSADVLISVATTLGFSVEELAALQGATRAELAVAIARARSSTGRPAASASAEDAPDAPGSPQVPPANVGGTASVPRPAPSGLPFEVEEAVRAGAPVVVVHADGIEMGREGIRAVLALSKEVEALRLTDGTPGNPLSLPEPVGAFFDVQTLAGLRGKQAFVVTGGNLHACLTRAVAQLASLGTADVPVEVLVPLPAVYNFMDDPWDATLRSLQAELQRAGAGAVSIHRDDVPLRDASAPHARIRFLGKLPDVPAAFHSEPAWLKSLLSR